MSFNHLARVLSSPITCKAIVLLANSSSGAFIQTPPQCVMLMNSCTCLFLMILRKCFSLLSPFSPYLPCSNPPISVPSNSPFGFEGLLMKCACNSLLAPYFSARRLLLISSVLLLSADFHRLWENKWAENPEDTVKLLYGTVRFTCSSTHRLCYGSVISVEV